MNNSLFIAEISQLMEKFNIKLEKFETKFEDDNMRVLISGKLESESD